MQGIEADAENDKPRVTIDADGTTGVQRAADAASAVSRALAAAGYEPRHLSVTSSASGELVLVARLEEQARGVAAAAPEPAPDRHWPVFVRLAIGITLGVLLGFLGLPRLELPALNAPGAPTPVPAPPPQIISIQDLASADSAPTPLPTLPVPTVAPTFAPTVAPVLFDMPLSSPIAGWLNDPQSTAWFAPDGYRVLARDAGRFVAMAVPLGRPVQDVVVSATFHKVGGPPGGGYGVILRDQGQPTDRDGRNQAGKYLVFEVGDRGDVGIWQRDDTHWIDVAPWQHSSAVHLDSLPNSLAVTSRGSNLVFEVNGERLAELNYDRLPNSGGVGIFVGGDLNEVALERLRIAHAN